MTPLKTLKNIIISLFIFPIFLFYLFFIFYIFSFFLIPRGGANAPEHSPNDAPVGMIPKKRFQCNKTPAHAYSSVTWLFAYETCGLRLVVKDLLIS